MLEQSTNIIIYIYCQYICQYYRFINEISVVCLNIKLYRWTLFIKCIRYWLCLSKGEYKTEIFNESSD